MKTSQKLVTWIVVVLLAFNTSCMAVGSAPSVDLSLQMAPGMVESLQVATTLRGMLGCIQGVQGTSIMLNAESTLMLLSWTYRDGNVGFVILDLATKTLSPNFGTTAVPGLPVSGSVTGNISALETWKSLTDFLKTKGWSYCGAGGVWGTAWAALVTGVGTWVNLIATTMPTFIFIVHPVDGSFDWYEPVLDDYYPAAPIELG